MEKRLSARCRYIISATQSSPLRRYGIIKLQAEFAYGCLHFSSVIFSITGKCNYNCLHCSVNAPEAPLGEFSFERIEELLDEMKDCGLKNIVLIGGEPLVRRDFMQIVDAILQRGMFVVQIFTNESLVNEALLDELDKRKISPTFMISFDGVGYHPDKAAVTPACSVYRRELI